VADGVATYGILTVCWPINALVCACSCGKAGCTLGAH